MTVSNVSSSIPTAEPADPLAPVGKSTLDRQDFMNLFITQLQYQDPMKPMDSYEMASQLAQFSSMDATMKMADSMDQLLAYQTSQNNLQLLNLIDKDVQALGNQMGVVDGAASPTEFNLADAAETCTVDIYDAGGHLVKTIDMGYQPSGSHELAWDGQTMFGEQAEDGAYSYKVDALNAAGEKIDVDYQTSGHVTGLEFDSGQAVLTVDKYVNIDVSNVLTVK